MTAESSKAHYDKQMAEALGQMGIEEELAKNDQDGKKKGKKKSKKRNTKKSKKESPPADGDMRDSPHSPVESDDGSNDGGEYCICRGPDDHRKMIACEACNEWFHCSCVGLKDVDVLLIDMYICEKCKIEGKKFTTWRPTCRLVGCPKPCRATANPPSKFCSDDHRRIWAEEQVAKAPDGPGSSRGGAITKGELRALLEQTKDDVKKFHALGKKPEAPAAAVGPDWPSLLTTEEKARLTVIKIMKITLGAQTENFKDREALVRMALARQKKFMAEHEELVGMCGYDMRLSYNEEEMKQWKATSEGQKAFATGELGWSGLCEKKKCLRHHQWVKGSIQDARFEMAQIATQLQKLFKEEHEMKARVVDRMTNGD